MVALPVETTIEHAHWRSIKAPVQEIASTLQTLLSQRLTAYLAGVNEGKTVSRWASGEVTEIRDIDVEQRLRTAYEVAQFLGNYDAASTIKSWFIGLNPQLEDRSPAEALREGQLREVVLAARSFVAHG